MACITKTCITKTDTDDNMKLISRIYLQISKTVLEIITSWPISDLYQTYIRYRSIWIFSFIFEDGFHIFAVAHHNRECSKMPFKDWSIFVKHLIHMIQVLCWLEIIISVSSIRYSLIYSYNMVHWCKNSLKYHQKYNCMWIKDVNSSLSARAILNIDVEST